MNGVVYPFQIAYTTTTSYSFASVPKLILSYVRSTTDPPVLPPYIYSLPHLLLPPNPYILDKSPDANDIGGIARGPPAGPYPGQPSGGIAQMSTAALFQHAAPFQTADKHIKIEELSLS